MPVRYTNAILITVSYIIGLIFINIFKLSLFINTIIFFIAILIYTKYKKILLFIIPFIVSIFISLIGKTDFYYKNINHFLNKKSIIKFKIISHPSEKKKQWINFLARVKEINGYRVKSTIKVFSKITTFNKGDALLVQGKINKPEGPDNFGEINYGLYYKRLKIDGVLFLNKKRQILLLMPINKFTLTYFASIIRNDVKRYIREYKFKIQKGFLNAILLGDRGFIPYKLKNIFINTGTVHILAISGLHLGIIMFIIFCIFQFFRIPPKYSLLITLLIVIFYNSIIGYREPIIRATVMFASFIICYLFDRDRDYLNALFIAALFILIINPDALNKTSFHLSTLATAGIILFAPDIENLFKFLKLYNTKWGNYLVKLFSASVASQILIIPVLILNFKKYAFLSIIINLIAIPLITIILGLAIVGYIIYHILPFISILLIFLNNLLIAVLIYILKTFSLIKPLYFASISPALLILYYILIFIIFYKKFVQIPVLKKLVFKKVKLQYAIITVLSLIILIPLFLKPKVADTVYSYSTAPEIIIFNIKGRSIFIRTSYGKNILIDGGYKRDAKKHIIPFLRRNYIKDLDYVLLTNPLEKRAEGLLEIVKRFKIRYFIDTGYLYKKYHYHRLIELITQKGINCQIANAGKYFKIDNLKMYILNPPAGFFRKIESSKVKEEDNIMNNSMVIKISWKKQNILLAGDIRMRAIKFLSRNMCDKLKSNIIVLPDINYNEFFIYRLLNCASPKLMIMNKKFTFFERHDKKFIKKLAKKYDAKIIFTQERGAVKLYERNGKIKYITSK